MKTLIVVPARYASTRFPGKPLVELTGADGKTKSLIQRSWEAAMAVENVDVVVATDDDRIKDAAEAFGATVVMTSEDCANGTERCADAIANMEADYDLIVNLQGDAPLSPAWFVQDLIDSFATETGADMATPVLRCDPETIAAFKSDRAAGQVGGTTAVFDKKEGLEQLRFLENGRHIQCVEVDGKGRAFWEVNNPSDVPRVNMMLQKLGIV